jgi:hypothetical protein
MARAIDPKQKLIHRLLYVGIALFFLAGIGIMLAQQTQSLDGAISLEQLEKNLGQDPYHFIVLDVRTPDEFRAGHIPFAVNVPLDQLPRRLGEFHEIKDRQFAVVCESGVRSSKAAQLMKQNGFMSVVDVPDGTAGWRSSGRELSTDNKAPLRDLVQ